MPDGRRTEVINVPFVRVRRRTTNWGSTNEQVYNKVNESVAKYADESGKARWTGPIRYLGLVFTTIDVPLQDLVDELTRVGLTVHMSVDGHVQAHVDDWVLEMHWYPVGQRREAQKHLHKWCDGKSKKAPAGGELLDFDSYTHVYRVRGGGPDDDMAYFNDWLVGIERVLHFDPNAVWDSIPTH